MAIAEVCGRDGRQGVFPVFLPNPFAFDSQFAKSGILRIVDGTFLRRVRPPRTIGSDQWPRKNEATAALKTWMI